jgi:hypothetical protein
MVGRGKFPLSHHRPYIVHGILIVKGQDEGSAIRFSLTSLPDSGKFSWEGEALRSIPDP